MDLDIQPVTLETRHAFSSLLDDANAWQTAKGSQGWTEPFDDAWLLPRIARGELYLASLDGTPVATLRILREDRAFWGAREVGDSLYLHTFAVRRDKAGLRIGEAVIRWVLAMARDEGLARVRLDCFLANAGLVAFYERNGFASVGSTVLKGRLLNLMERRIADEPVGASVPALP